MRIAWFTCQEKDKRFSPSAYLTKMIVPRLKKLGVEVTIFSDVVTGEVHHYLNAGKLHELDPFHIFFHQVEEGSDAHFLRTAVGLYPGLTFFHDLYLSDLGPDPLTNSPWSIIADFLDQNSGHHQLHWPNRKTEFPRTGPFPQREVGLCWGAIFANPRLRQDCRCRLESTNTRTEKLTSFIPYPVEIGGEGATHITEQKKIAIHGGPFIEDRIHKILMGIRGASGSPKIEWMVAPKFVPTAKQRLVEFGLTSATVIEESSLEAWQKIVSTSSIAMHLHYSVFGSIAPFVEVSMSEKVPVLISGQIDDRYYPEDVIIAVPPGPGETRFISRCIDLLLREKIENSAGAKFVKENNNPDSIAHEFLAAFETYIRETDREKKIWKQVAVQAKAALLTEINPTGQSTFKKVFDELGWS